MLVIMNVKNRRAEPQCTGLGADSLDIGHILALLALCEAQGDKDRETKAKPGRHSAEYLSSSSNNCASVTSVLGIRTFLFPKNRPHPWLPLMFAHICVPIITRMRAWSTA